jgi:hypothetical protein
MEKESGLEWFFFWTTSHILTLLGYWAGAV